MFEKEAVKECDKIGRDCDASWHTCRSMEGFRRRLTDLTLLCDNVAVCCHNIVCHKITRKKCCTRWMQVIALNLYSVLYSWCNCCRQLVVVVLKFIFMPLSFRIDSRCLDIKDIGRDPWSMILAEVIINNVGEVRLNIQIG